MLLAVVQLVVLKMLPFDNKSEFQVVVNMPEGTPVEGTARVLAALAAIVRQVPEVTDYQAYAGTSAPINFNGLVRQYYLRGDSSQGDLQVNLVDKSAAQPQEPRHRARGAPGARRRGQAARRRLGAGRRGAARAARAGAARRRDLRPGLRRAAADRTRAAGACSTRPRTSSTPTTRCRHRRRAMRSTLDRAEGGASRRPAGRGHRRLSRRRLAGRDATYVHAGRERDPIAVRLELPSADKQGLEQALALPVRAASRRAGSALRSRDGGPQARGTPPIYHKDLLPVVFVTGDMAGRLDSPLYGMFSLVSQIGQLAAGGSARSCSASSARRIA